MSSLSRFCSRVMEAGWLAIVVSIPLFFNILSNRIFEPDKITVLRSLVVLVLLAWFVKFLEDQRSAANGVKQAKPDSKAGQELVSKFSNPLLLPVLVYLGLYLISTALSVDQHMSIWGSYQRLQGAYTMLSYAALFFVIAYNLRSQDQLDRLVTVVILTSIPISLYGVIQHFGLDPLPWGSDVTTRVASTMGNPIFVAAYLIMVVPITLARLVEALVLSYKQKDRLWKDINWGRAGSYLGVILVTLLLMAYLLYAARLNLGVWLVALPAAVVFLLAGLYVARPVGEPRDPALRVLVLSLALLLQIVTIIFSLSRGTWMGLLTGLAVFGMLVALLYGGFRLRLATVGSILVVVAFLIVFNLPQTPLAPLRDAPYFGRLGHLLESGEGTGKVRLLIWGGVLRLVQEHPSPGLVEDPLSPFRPLIGYGPETLYYTYPKVYPPELAYYEARNATPDRSHNEFLDQLSMDGLLGLMAFLLILNTFIFHTLETIGLIQRKERRWALAVILAFSIVGAVLYVLWQRLRPGALPKPSAEARPFILLVIGLLSAVVAHFVEVMVGISIVATNTYYWLALGLAVVAPYVASRREAAAVSLVVPGMAGGSNSPIQKGTSRVGKKEKRRDGRSPTTGGRSQRRDERVTFRAVGSLPLYMALAYAGLTVLVAILLSRIATLQDPYQTLSFAFSWFAVGILVAAALLTGPEKVLPWRGQNWWLYASLAFLASAIIWVNLRVIAADTYYKQALVMERNQVFAENIDANRKAVVLAPQEDFYHLMLGRAFLELAKRKADQQPSQQSITWDQVLNSDVRQLVSLGREDLLKAAVVSLERAKELAPLNTDHYSNLALLHRVWGLSGAPEHLDIALEYYDQTTRISPNVAHNYVGWSQLYLLEQEPQDALAKAEKAIALDPRFAPGFVARGDAYWELGQRDQALADHSKALELAPNALADERFEARLSSYVNSPYAEAMVVALDKALQLNPKDSSFQLHNSLGFLLSKMGRTQEAVSHFQAASALAPKDWLTYRNLAILYRDLGMLDQAINSTQGAILYAPPEQKQQLQDLLLQLQRQKGAGG